MDVEIIKKNNIFVSTTFIKNGNKISKAIDLKKNKIFNIELGSNHLYEKNYNYIKKNKKFNFLTHNYFPIQKILL